MAMNLSSRVRQPISSKILRKKEKGAALMIFSRSQLFFSHVKLTQIRIGSLDTLQLPYENINKFNLDVDLHLESGYTQN